MYYIIIHNIHLLHILYFFQSKDFKSQNNDRGGGSQRILVSLEKTSRLVC